MSLPQERRALLSDESKKLIWLATALAIFVSLISFSPSDPSWSTWSSKNQLQNWMGRGGSFVSDLLIQLLGASSFGICGLLILFGIRSPTEDGTKKSTQRIVFGGLVLLALSSLFQVFLVEEWAPWGLDNSGGLIGLASHRTLSHLFGKWGTPFFSTVLLLVCTLSLIQWSHWKGITRRIASFCKALLFSFSKLTLSIRKLPFKFGSPFHRQFEDEVDPFSLKEAIRFQNMAAESSEGNSRALSNSTYHSSASPPVQSGEGPLVLTSHSKHKRNRMALEPKDFKLPSLTLLAGKSDSKSKSVDKSWFLEKGNILVQKLKDFGVEGEVVNISPGPVITVYEFKPASGVKIKDIANLSDDLTLALSVLSVRIVAPIPGKPVVGIEIPSPHRETVFFKDLVQETPFFKGELKIPIVLGRLASGEPVVSDLASMPHLLIAGTTGTGKSVFINTLICSLLYRFTPQELKLILVDPKMVELSHYEGIPHLLLPVVVDSKKAAMALRWTVDEMERRYKLMHQFGVRHLDAYNERLHEVQKDGLFFGQEFLPYIVVVIDEYADLMAVVPKDVEMSIARLAQKARASGIHLVLATQRPSTDVVTGTIKANFPSRISFRVASAIDSKTILDRAGADRLLGNGDLLFHSAGFTTLKRMQGSFLFDQNIEKIVEHLKSQGVPEYDQRILLEQDENGEAPEDPGEDKDNELFDAAVRLVTERGEASISLIQRHLRIGYNRAATLMDQLETAGIVGQSTGTTKRRPVLANPI